jgi:hypothetical protein
MANLTPQGKQYYETSAGIPLVGGKVYTYIAGTTTPQVTYQDSAGASPNANPVILDARGEATIYWNGNYKVILRDSLDNLIWTQDNVSSFATLVYDRIAAESAVTIVNFAYLPGNVLRYGVNTTPGTTDLAAALVTANAVAAASKLQVIIPQLIHVGSATTVTAPIYDTLSQMFSATSQVTLSGCAFVRPEWWGTGQNTVRFAINSLPSTGGVVQLENATYQPNGYVYGFGGTGVYVSKDNVTIRGRTMPRLSTDCTNLEGGSIIQGMFLVYANNFQMSDCGIDTGLDVVAAFYGGVTSAGITEGLNITYPDNATKAAAALRLQARLHNVIGLCAAPQALNHAVIAGEGYAQIVCTGEVVGCFGVHGVVFKCSSVRAESVVAFLNDSEGVVFKSDTQATAIATDIQVDRIYSRAQGPLGFSPYDTALGTQAYGVMIHASGNPVDKIQINQIRADGAVVGIGNVFGANLTSSSIKIGTAIIDQSGVGGTRIGLQLLGSAAQAIVRWHIDHLEVRNSSVGAQFAFSAGPTQNQHCHINHLHVALSLDAVDIGSSSYVSIGTVTTDACTQGVYHITGTPKLVVGSLFQDTLTPATYDASTGGLVPALSNAWSQVAANDVFGIDLLGGRTNLRGLVKPGVSSTLATLPQWAWPVTNKRFMVQGYNGVAVVSVPLLVSSAGIVQVNEVAGGFANCTSWLSLSGVTYDNQA